MLKARGRRNEKRRHGAHRHQSGKDKSSSHPIRQHAHGNARKRTQQHRRSHQRGGLRRRQFKSFRNCGAKALIRPQAAKQTVNEMVPNATWSENAGCDSVFIGRDSGVSLVKPRRALEICQ
jgi:hypothetical protein